MPRIKLRACHWHFRLGWSSSRYISYQPSTRVIPFSLKTWLCIFLRVLNRCSAASKFQFRSKISISKSKGRTTRYKTKFMNFLQPLVSIYIFILYVYLSVYFFNCILIFVNKLFCMLLSWPCIKKVIQHSGSEADFQRKSCSVRVCEIGLSHLIEARVELKKAVETITQWCFQSWACSALSLDSFSIYCAIQ